MKKKFKENQKIWALYVNVTSFYISFKIEEGKYLGELDPKMRANLINIHIIEHYDDEVNYLAIDDIFASEEEAEKHLAQIILDKYSKKS